MRNILAYMNVNGAPVQGGLPTEAPRIISEPPVNLSTGQFRMDPTTTTANVIGNSTPTAADFHSMLFQTNPGKGGHAPYLPHRSVGAEQMYIPKEAKEKEWRINLLNLARNPIAVGIIVFFLNLPIVTSILSRYASWMYLSSGEISMSGLAVKALLSAMLYGLYQMCIS